MSDQLQADSVLMGWGVWTLWNM